MNRDIRLVVGLFNNHKILKLRKRLGSDGVLSLIQLWCWAAENKPKGIFGEMADEDVELVAGWIGAPGEFISALKTLKLIDQTKDGLVLHDWALHQPWVAHSEERSQIARQNALYGWEKRRGGRKAYANGMQMASNSHADRIAPSPSPTTTTSVFEDTVGQGNGNGKDEAQSTGKTEEPAFELVADQTKTKKTARTHKKPKPNVWGELIHLHRERELHDPSPDGASLKAAQELGELIPEASERKSILAAFLDDQDDWLTRQGHAIWLLPKRIGRYRNGQRNVELDFDAAASEVARGLRAAPKSGGAA